MKILEIDRRGFLRGAAAAVATATTGGALAKKPAELPITGYYQVFVKPGDTIYSLARGTQTDPREIMKLNGFNNKTQLEKGQLIKIPEYGKNSEHPEKPQHTTPVKNVIEPEKHTEPSKHKEPGSPIPSEPAHGKKSNSALQEPDFLNKLVQVAQELGVSAKALFGIIRHESHFKHHISNPHTGAIGLIQFMPKTARHLGTSTHQLAKMTGTQQLDYVYKFLKPKVRPGMDIGDMYMAVFLPSYVGAAPNTVLGKKGGGHLPGTDLSMHKIWEQNPAFSNDLAKPYFTVGDVKNRLSTFLPS
jgi:murein DD-endopeptidase MepM/ murein hydrolase activator NlpD